MNNKIILATTKQSSIDLEPSNEEQQKENLQPVNIIVEDLKPDPRIKELHNALNKIISEDFTESNNHLN